MRERGSYRWDTAQPPHGQRRWVFAPDRFLGHRGLLVKHHAEHKRKVARP